MTEEAACRLFELYSGIKYALVLFTVLWFLAWVIVGPDAELDLYTWTTMLLRKRCVKYPLILLAVTGVAAALHAGWWYVWYGWPCSGS